MTFPQTPKNSGNLIHQLIEWWELDAWLAEYNRHVDEHNAALDAGELESSWSAAAAMPGSVKGSVIFQAPGGRELCLRFKRWRPYRPGSDHLQHVDRNDLIEAGWRWNIRRDDIQAGTPAQ